MYVNIIAMTSSRAQVEVHAKGPLDFLLYGAMPPVSLKKAGSVNDEWRVLHRPIT
jgi:hypothetical protein